MVRLSRILMLQTLVVVWQSGMRVGLDPRS